MFCAILSSISSVTIRKDNGELVGAIYYLGDLYHGTPWQVVNHAATKGQATSHLLPTKPDPRAVALEVEYKLTKGVVIEGLRSSLIAIEMLVGPESQIYKKTKERAERDHNPFG